jgi:hypothetical protein
MVPACLQDLGLGVVTSLLWVDMFNVIQCVMVLLAVANSLFVHILFKSQHDRLASTIDRVSRYSVPFVLYPVVTAGTIVWGLEQRVLCPDSDTCGWGRTTSRFQSRPEPTAQSVGAAIMAVGAILTVLGSIVFIIYHVEKRQREQILTVSSLVELALKAAGNDADNDADNDAHNSEPADESSRIERVREHAVKWHLATSRVFVRQPASIPRPVGCSLLPCGRPCLCKPRCRWIETCVRSASSISTMAARSTTRRCARSFTRCTRRRTRSSRGVR